MYIIENDAQFTPWCYQLLCQRAVQTEGNDPWSFINDTFGKLLRQAENKPNEAKRAKLYKLQEILADELLLCVR